MQRCIELANMGKGNTSPNPMVGCVIVHNQEIIGEGFHRDYGGPHAEVNAINSVKNQALLKNSTLYVNLEPCSHHGNTPPCSDLIINKKIPRVVIGIQDPNKKVSGAGIKRLQKAGIEVKVNVLKETCLQLNKRFLTYHRLARPFVVLKWAQTRDGFIDVERDSLAPNKPTWISNEISRTLVHKWRTEEQSIMVGTHTAQKDNPSLTIRDWHGKQPLRIVLDRTLRLTNDLVLFDQLYPTWVYNEIKDNQVRNISYRKIAFDDTLVASLLSDLYKQNYISVFVEGGYQLLKSFIDADCWDEARVFIGKNFFHQGVKAPNINFGFVKETKFDEDTLFIIKNYTF
ncbi:MAG: bifunctional diaminohydroxyphosphoribosylaminopyrimidine deaminase/5-amino-6-(5-phosphoribosylamino)uracil reductase RibD [Bacteroidetes bacterium]|nr:bifunctional diaminohydroxyphosphoribosylaminopyrimidine deaminase/5-amino-6-(5-phosphoribosylamino)uracil reductase RibD [Bacteroidota bacterium]